MDFRAIVAAWLVGIAVMAGALYFATVKRSGAEYAGIEPGVHVPRHDDLPQTPRIAEYEPLEIYPGDR
ncbi:MAG: hypothetical protein HY059_04330 [Proteobacteria bacterium]|nr:hypothetical protein [Pseudomonadota bacterium]